MKQKMRVQLEPEMWSTQELKEYNFNYADYYEITEMNGKGSFKLKGKEEQGFWNGACFTTPEPVPDLTPCPADWQPAEGHSVDHYEAVCIEPYQKEIKKGDVYKLAKLHESDEKMFYVFVEGEQPRVYYRFRFATPTLRAEYRDKPEQPIENIDKLPDMVNHPTHYTDGGIETIDFIESKKLDYYTGNAVKYISRAGKKDASKEIQDLQKAIWYINRKISKLKQTQDEAKSTTV